MIDLFCLSNNTFFLFITAKIPPRLRPERLSILSSDKKKLNKDSLEKPSKSVFEYDDFDSPVDKVFKSREFIPLDSQKSRLFGNMFVPNRLKKRKNPNPRPLPQPKKYKKQEKEKEKQIEKEIICLSDSESETDQDLHFVENSSQESISTYKRRVSLTPIALCTEGNIYQSEKSNQIVRVLSNHIEFYKNEESKKLEYQGSMWQVGIKKKNNIP